MKIDVSFSSFLEQCSKIDDAVFVNLASSADGSVGDIEAEKLKINEQKRLALKLLVYVNNESDPSIYSTDEVISLTKKAKINETDLLKLIASYDRWKAMINKIGMNT